MRSSVAYFCVIAIVLAAPAVVGECLVQEDGSCQSRSEDEAALLQTMVNRPSSRSEDEDDVTVDEDKEEASEEKEEEKEEKPTKDEGEDDMTVNKKKKKPSEEKEEEKEEKPTKDEGEEDDGASLAHSGADVHALKQSVIEKTKKFAKAMQSLESVSKKSMTDDFQEVLRMFKDDVEGELGEPAEKKGALLHTEASAGATRMKRAILTKTGNFAKAIKSLLSTSNLAMKSDFDLAWAEYKDDIEGVVEPSKDHSGHFTQLADEGSAAHLKEAIVEKTEALREAMHDLASSSTDHLKQDFNDVMKAYTDDVHSDLPESADTDDKDTSLIHASAEEGVASVKTHIVEATQDYLSAMDELETVSEDGLKSDLEGIMTAYSDEMQEMLADKGKEATPRGNDEESHEDEKDEESREDEDEDDDE